MSFQLEVIAFTIESCLIAEQAGVHRIELCDNPAEGGTTPSYGMIKTAREKTGIQLYPIIRPRGGDFLYSEDEFIVMQQDVKMCRALGCDGVVIGLLKADGTIDKERCSRLIEIAYPLGVTFHRAFDRVKDPFQTLEELQDIGIERILTSGLQPTALEGKNLLRNLVSKAGERISIMPGSGVRSENILELASHTGAWEFHTSARKTIDSKMNYINPEMKESLTTVQLDEFEVSRMIGLLQEHFEKSASNS